MKKRTKQTSKPSYETDSAQEADTTQAPVKTGSSMTTKILIGLLIVGAYFVGVLTTKVQYLEKGQAAAGGTVQQAQAQQPQPTLGKQNVDVGHFPAQGDPNAKVKIIAFEDFRCPFCEQFYKTTEKQIIDDYVKTGKAVLYFRNYQFLGDASVVAGNAAECANEQGKFWEMHNYFYDNQPSESDTSMYNSDKLTEIAGTLGMNTDQFKNCLDTKKYQKNLDKDFSEGQKAGVNATPTMFVNGNPVIGAQPYTAFKTLIDQELK